MQNNGYKVLAQVVGILLAIWLCAIPASSASTDFTTVTIQGDSSTIPEGAVLAVLDTNSAANAIAAYITNQTGANATAALVAVNLSSHNSAYAISTGALLESAYMDFAEIAAPATPPANKARVYVKSDGLFYGKDDAGTETQLSNAAGGGMTSWTLSGDSGADQTITDGNTVEINGTAAGIDVAASATDTVTVSFDASEITTYAAPSGFNITVNSANPKRSVTFNADDFFAPATSPASGVDSAELTNLQNVMQWQFSSLADAYVQANFIMPDNWDAADLTFIIYWSTNSTGTDGVVWRVEANAYGDGEDMDVAWGTAAEVTDAEQNSTTELLKTASTTLSLGGTGLAGGDWVILRIYRDYADANDTEAGNASLHGLKLEYGINAYTE